jgi:hypothetical protein
MIATMKKADHLIVSIWGFIVGMMLARSIIYGLRNGELYTKPHHIRRETRPVAFWFVGIVSAIVVVSITIMFAGCAVYAAFFG